jgi:hypothetical protein
VPTHQSLNSKEREKGRLHRAYTLLAGAEVFLQSPQQVLQPLGQVLQPPQLGLGSVFQPLVWIRQVPGSLPLLGFPRVRRDRKVRWGGNGGATLLRAQLQV